MIIKLRLCNPSMRVSNFERCQKETLDSKTDKAEVIDGPTFQDFLSELRVAQNYLDDLTLRLKH